MGHKTHMEGTVPPRKRLTAENQQEILTELVRGKRYPVAAAYARWDGLIDALITREFVEISGAHLYPTPAALDVPGVLDA